LQTTKIISFSQNQVSTQHQNNFQDQNNILEIKSNKKQSTISGKYNIKGLNKKK
jgi:hypothetical protein